jgi:hypothetical protein
MAEERKFLTFEETQALRLEGMIKVGSHVPGCPTCDDKPLDMKPSHCGSKRCESGSIASGGTHSHCSCGTCF